MEKRTFSDAELADLCEELAVTLEAGIPIGEGFLLLAEQERDGGRREVLYGIYERIDRGEPADEAMAAAGSFPAYLVRMVGLGAATGSLDRVLRALGEYWKRRVRRREIVRTAVSYPLLLLAVVLVVFCVFLTDVLPVFDGVYAQMGATMAAPARALLGAGNALRAVRAPLLALLALAADGALAVWARPAWRAKAVNRLEKRTARTRMGVRLARAQFAAALSLAYTAVADFAGALELAAEACGNAALRAQAERCCERMNAGEDFAGAAAGEGLFDPLYCRMLAVGVRAGNPDGVLREIAARAERDFERAADRAVARVEPVSVLALALVVGLLMAAIMLPLVGLLTAV